MTNLATCFQNLKKIHAMLTRKSEKFKVQYANAERLKKSPLIYMQRLLNSHDANLNDQEN